MSSARRERASMSSGARTKRSTCTSSSSAPRPSKSSMRPRRPLGPHLSALRQRARVPLPRSRLFPPVGPDPPHLTSPYHPETNGKVERYHRTIKEQVKLVVHGTPSVLEKAVAAFVDYCSHRRYHEGIGSVTQADVYYGRREESVQRRKEVSRRALQQRRDHHRVSSEQETGRKCLKSADDMQGLVTRLCTT